MKKVDLSGEQQQNWLNEVRRRLREGLPPPGMSEDDVLQRSDGTSITVKEFIAQKKREDAMVDDEEDEG